ncbi:FAD-dependent oxidoreductase [Sphingomonas donggukensis]|uniref:FAD-dependent oxidoreductase n=1 Tax=Sphingomonas donggukensis TaxID=2949093 RepID=A0ABY4TS16_9SPHN|nr:NAD(P)/FAD-dependent oxidoreductase [Sphingomonas donggukensis]URW75203.1 FAD-dependent oxidoreductase [Sphingomonas donggukensis]
MRGPTAFWQAMEAARQEHLRARGLPAPVPGGDGLSRRQLIVALAGTAAAAALPRPVRAAASGPVAIIGGGIAGLSALWHLTNAGIDARLFEARTRLGGRMYTARAKGAPPFEMGGQLVNTEHADMHALCKAFGIALIDRKGAPHRTMILDGGTELPRDRLIAGLRGIAGQIDADAAALDKDYARVAAALDRLSFTGYLDKYAALMPDDWARRLMEATARTEYGVEPAQASALELVFNLPSVAGRRIDVLSRSDERFLISGGSSTLVEAMGKRLASRIVTYRRLTRVDPKGAGVRLTFSNDETFDAANVIVTTPASVMSKVAYGVPLPTLWRQFIAEVGLGLNGKVQVATTARPWEKPIGRGGEIWQVAHDVGSSLGWDGGVRPSPGAGSVWTWFTGGREVRAADLPDARALALRWAKLAEAGVPGMAAATGATVRRTNWHDEPFTGGGYVNFRTGQLTKFADLIWTEANGVASSPLSAGPVIFAGEHLSDAYPGYMNGGAQTGRLAAQAIIAARAPARRMG